MTKAVLKRGAAYRPCLSWFFPWRLLGQCVQFAKALVYSGGNRSFAGLEFFSDIERGETHYSKGV